MKQLIASAFLFVVLATLLAITSANSDQGGASGTSEESHSKFGLPNPFDYLSFKRFYHKDNNSPVEDASRLKVFLARCYQVFVSAVGYLHGRNKYFLRINERADWTPAELEASMNKFTISAMLEASGDSQVDEHGANKRKNEPDASKDAPERSEEDPLVEPEELATELKEIRVKSNQEPELKLLSDGLDELNSAGLKRRKRGIGGSRDNFKIEQAFNMKPAEGEESQGRKQIKRRVVMRDEKEARSYKNLPVKGNHRKRGFVRTITDMFKNHHKHAEREESTGSGDLAAPKAKAGDGNDIVWVDHRESGCMQRVLNQGICGSCFAFASLAWLEWLHCNNTGEHIKFSEQYMVDCGPPNQPGVNGCSGSNFYRAAEFITNFGLELRQNYPYSGVPNQCPYEPNRKPEDFGLYRADVSDVLVVGMKFAELYLDKWPIMVEMHATGDFMWYGGGVWDGKGCKSMSNHCVLIVGHGREDSEEYWLIRNSYGPGWGEKGYMKLNKNTNCIFLPQGYIFGTVDGKENILSIARNKNVPAPVPLKFSAVNFGLVKSKLMHRLNNN